MANYLETGDTGQAITAESDGALFAGIFGLKNYVLENGGKLEAEIQSNNIVKISDGDAVMYGRHVRIPANDSALVTINNGHSGKNRIDVIVFRYLKDGAGKESVELVAIQGDESTGTAAAPATVEGNLLTGSTKADFPLYKVEINGLNIVSVTKLFETIGNISQLAEENKKLSAALDYDPTEKRYTEDGWLLIYRYISKNQVRVVLEKTNRGVTEAKSREEILSACPLKTLFSQEIPVRLSVSNTVVGHGAMTFSGNTVYLSSTSHNNDATWHGYGIITVG